jgi:hypothetical protein
MTIEQGKRLTSGIASGVLRWRPKTESQCRGLTARLKGRGRRRNRQGIDAHLAISCLYRDSNQWQAYCPNAQSP